MPTEGKFFEIFNAHAKCIVSASRELELLIDNLANAEVHKQNVQAAEKQADKLTHEAIDLLHKTFITPLDRDHIHQLVNAMDDICDLIQDTTETLTLYDIRSITPETQRLSDIAVKCCERVKDVVELLGKQDGNFEALLKTCEEIDRLESDADRVMRSAMSKLFREEQEVREIIKMKEIYELLEAVTDRCLDVANLAEGISLENT